MPLSNQFDSPDYRLIDDEPSVTATADDDGDLARTTTAPQYLSLRASRNRFALPAQPNALVGRDALVGQLTDYLEIPRTRLLTLVGPGGIGKTSLACELARRWEREHDIVRFIDLTQINDSADFGKLIDDALGPTRLASEPNSAQKVVMLGNHRILVILDNFEHVIDAAPQVADMLSEAPWLQVIATSRTPLRLRWELVSAVPPLAVPRDGGISSVTELAAVPSVALFMTFAQRIQPEFTLTVDNASAVAELCRRMEGLPLALELAANDLHAIPIERLCELAGRPLDLLVRGPRDLPQRQQAMRASFEWSYQLLSPEEQRIARHLAIFPDGGTMAAASAVVQLSTDDAYHALASLVQQNLIELLTVDEVQPRFRMPRMVREYLSEQLALDAERPDLLQRFTDYYAHLAAAACSQLSSPNAPNAERALQAELGNIRALLERSVREREIAEGLKLAISLMPMWERPGYLSEGRTWLTRLIDLAPDDHMLTSEGRIAATRLAVITGDLHAAQELLSVTEDPTVPQPERTLMLAWLSYVQLFRGDVARANDALHSIIEAATGGTPISDEMSVRFLRAMIAVERGDDDAHDLLEDAINEADQMDDPSRAIFLLCRQAELELTHGRTATAARLLADALVRAQVARSPLARINSLIGLGDLADDQQTPDEALHHYREALDLALSYDDAISQVRILERFAALGSSPRVHPVLLGAIGLADALRTRLGLGRSAYDERRVAPRIQQAEELLGAVEFSRVRAIGETRTVAQVLEALDEPRRTRPRVNPRVALNDKSALATIEHLTRREREVVQQISRGYTNRQIAANLGMAERTVDTHIGNIRQKLHVQSRAQIAVWAVANGLSSPD